MFSLLGSFSLWLGAALMVPLAIHFLGKQRQKKIQFPSLLLVREQFSKSMHRHRLKNLLLLIIRTLILLCLLFALTHPVYNALGGSQSHADKTLVLIHNGIYGKVPLKSGQTVLEMQRNRHQTLDSSEGKSTQAIAMIAQGMGPWEVSERYGDYSEAIHRMLLDPVGQPRSVQWHIPVFSWTEILPVQENFLRALKENPNLRIGLTDFSDLAPNTRAITSLKSIPSLGGTSVKITAQINPMVAQFEKPKVQVFHSGRLFQEVTPLGDKVDLDLPLGLGSRTTGKIRLQEGAFACLEYHFSFPKAGSGLVIHSGSARTSLPSLGREIYYRKIMHVNGIKEIPWEMAKETRLVYLANDRMVDAAMYAKAVEYVKQGGRLILGVGDESDIPSLNRFLLQPLRIGRLGNVVEANPQAQPASEPAIQVNKSGIASLGKLPLEIGFPAKVYKHFAFVPDSGTQILLSLPPAKEGGAGPGLLASQAYFQGRVLLWTTDIDNLDWTDMGISPMTPLLHQAFQETGMGNRAQNFSIASDSTLTYALPEKISTEPFVLDPDSRPFTRLKQETGKLHLGPFDKLGVYRIIQGIDTSSFAVNLQSQPWDGVDWKETHAQARTDFLKAFKSFPGRLVVLAAKDPLDAKSASQPLWPLLILASILLLFVEGLIASTFSLRRSRA